MFSSVASKTLDGIVGRMMSTLRDRFRRSGSAADHEQMDVAVGADFLDLSRCINALSLHMSPDRRVTNNQALHDTVEQLTECLARIYASCLHNNSTKEAPVCPTEFSKEEGLILSLAAEVVSQLYVHQANNGRLFQKCKKALEKLRSLQPHIESLVEEEFQKLITASSSSEQGMNADDLNKVSSLLESSDLIRGFLRSNFLQILSSVALTLCCEVETQSTPDTGCVQPSRVPAMDACYQAAKVFLQMCQHGQDDLQPLLWEPSNGCHEDLYLIISGLLTLLEDQRFSKDCGLMAGSSLAMMLNSAPDPRQAAVAVANLLDRYSRQQSDRGPQTLQIGQFVLSATPMEPLPPLKPLPPSSMMFPQLAVTRGVLTCCNKAILLEDVSANQEHHLLCTEVLFPVVCDLCKAADGELKYHASEALKLYLQALKPLLPTLLRESSHPRLFGPDTAHTRAVLQLVWQEWQSPVDGVAEMIRSALTNLLDLHHQENKGRDSENSQLLDSITSSLLNTAWHVKGRYHLLTSIVPRISALHLLQTRPNLPKELLRCLGTNYLAAAATELHNALVRRLKEEVVTKRRETGGQRLGDDKEMLAERWGSLWKDVMLEGICSDDSLVRYHTAKYWLPAALKSFPGCFHFLMRELVKASTDQPLEKQVDEADVRQLHARIVLLKYARINSLLDADWFDTYHNTISAGLWHTEDEIQADAFACLCCSPKKSELPSDAEMRLFRETLPHFLNSDSAAFRNQLRHNTGAFVARTCDGGLVLVKHLKKLRAKTEIRNLHQEKDDTKVDSVEKPKRNAAGVKKGLSEIEKEQVSALKERLLQALDCLDWLAEVCFVSLFPGACYQRKRTAHDILGVVFEALLGDKQQKSKDTSSENLMAWALAHGKCNLLSARNASLLLECIQDGSNDLRSSSYHLLSTYYPAALPSSPAYPQTSSSQVMCLALQLVSSPKVQESEAGALLTKRIFYKHSVVKCLKKLDSDLSTPPGSPVKSNGPSAENGPVHFVESLLTSLAYQLKCCKKNLLQAAAVTPMHGLIRAIRRCVTDHPSTLECIFASDPTNWSTLMQKLLATVQDITGFILLILSGRDTASPVTEENRASTTMMAPSFGQMGEAIEKLIADLAAYRVGEGEESGEGGGGGGEEMLALSEEHQLILACCWLNLKECSLLLGALVETMPLCGEDDPGILTFDQLTLMADILVDVLTRCRHKGAIDGCNQGFAKLCSRLQASHCPKLQAIPKTILDRVLGMVTQVGAGSSFTKKSAGLPLLVESIVSAEPRGRERPLLTYVMRQLMDIASQPLPPDPNDRLDLPQAHALNVMMALFRCSAVGTDILRHCSSAVEMAIGGFASPCWMIRNCSMRLFGTLIARIFGQKKVQDEHSQINAMSAATFFTRYPTLKQFLLKELKKFNRGGAEPGSEDDGVMRSKVTDEERGPEALGQEQGREDVLSCTDDTGLEILRDARFQEGRVECRGEKGRLFLHPSLHPVLTLLSKLGPGVGSDDVQSLREFMQPVQQLAGSAIYAVRELAARSLVPLIPQCDMPQKIAGIIHQLPSSAQSVRDFNRLHGDLLQVEKLFEAAEQNESFQQEDLVCIQSKLSSRTWIAGDSNPCAPIRALFVNVALAVIAECHRVCPGSGAITCVSKMMDILRGYFESAPPPFQIGIATLNGVMSAAYLRLITLTSDTVTPDLLTSAQALLTSHDSDVKLATLAYLQSNVTDILDCGDVSRIQTLREKLANLLTDAELDIRCLEKALALWVDLGQGEGPVSELPCDWQCLWNALTGLVEGKRGSGLLAAALPAIGQMLQWSIQTNQNSWVYVDVWCNWMVTYSHPSQCETKRLATVQSVRIAAPIVWSKIADEHTEDQIDIALDLLIALLHLLQDEDQDIRLAAAGLVSLRLPRGAHCLQFSHLHCNVAQQVLVDYLCRAFFWSPKFMTSVLGLLQGSVDLSEATHQLASGGTHLFGQESANIYAEGVMEAKVLYQALVETVEREQAANPESFQTWLSSWCEAAPLLVDAQEDLAITQQMLETGVTMGGFENEVHCKVLVDAQEDLAITQQMLETGVTMGGFENEVHY
ncbi:thyroid adenoma-associated protein homolog isoform X2 [Patiria miniata]|uniref:DUF2428 domain-containing protein n=1 Tax=Patiria miniata TaxID=46514 RepID=A0A914BD32_PATMI|nr:thyroid adenoma-associated protein homolog isoform X2 [Patiria miniata]